MLIGKMQGDVIRGNIITHVSLVLSFVRDHTIKGMLVNMHTVFSSSGFILVNIEQGLASMKPIAPEEFAFFLTNLRSFDHCNNLWLKTQAKLKSYDDVLVFHIHFP